MCYKCEGPFHPLQQWPNRQLCAMLLDEDDEEKGDANVVEVEDQTDEEGDKGECSMMFSGNTTAEISQKPQTMKVRAMINGEHPNSM